MNRPEIVAELSANHGGRYESAIQLLRAAKDSGADSAKIQVWTPGSMVVDRSYLIKHGAWVGQPLAELYDRCHTPWQWLPGLFAEAKRLDLPLFASVFDAGALAVLESLGCPRYKIASFEMVDTRLIRQVARTGKPMVISTGMAEWDEIVDAAFAARAVGCPHLTILHCVSQYPVRPEGMPMRNILEMQRAASHGRLPCYGIGLSDHTTTATAAIVATALGATLIERHLMLDGDPHAEDRAFSSTPAAFRFMVDRVHEAAAMLQRPEFGPRPGDESELRRSLYAAHEIAAGTVITDSMLITARPAAGILANRIDEVVGKRARITIGRHTPITPDSIDGGI